jgi:opacity protein-like surface antigen
MKSLAALALLLIASPAFAQRFEVSPIVGYATESTIDQQAEGVDDLSVAEGITWGAQGTYFFNDHFGIEALWAYQSAAVSMVSGASRADLFTMTTNQLQGNAVYQFRGFEKAVRPYVFGGLGTTFFSAEDLESERKLSWTVGGGVKWFPQRHLGLKAHARYNPTRLDDASASVCDPFGFCQTALKHFEIGGGAIFRF